VTYVLMLVGCGLLFGDQPAPSELPDGAEAASLPDKQQTKVKPGASETRVLPERPPGCYHFFSEADANQAFAVATDAETDCAFEGIRAAGNQLVVRYKPTPETEVAITLMNASCEGDGDISGALRVAPADDAARSCPGAVAKIRALAANGSLPPGTPGAYGDE
jgi:hypothetical protein